MAHEEQFTEEAFPKLQAGVTEGKGKGEPSMGQSWGRDILAARAGRPCHPCAILHGLY